MTTKTKGRMCDGKSRFDDRTRAEGAMWAYVHRCGAKPSRLNVYACPHCDGWHWGHRGRR